MGLPDGWVTGLRLPRTAALRVLGNGVVWQQAATALRMLLCRASEPGSAGREPAGHLPVPHNAARVRLDVN